jgi:RNA polymerase sigma factor (sigma-70 family)
VSVVESISTEASQQDALYQEIYLSYCTALERLARAYEADQESCRDLLQEIHIALWRSLTGFDQRCSLRTWVYRVAHNFLEHANRGSYRERRNSSVVAETRWRARPPWLPRFR